MKRTFNIQQMYIVETEVTIDVPEDATWGQLLDRLADRADLVEVKNDDLEWTGTSFMEGDTEVANW